MTIGAGVAMVGAGFLATVYTIHTGMRREWIGWVGYALILLGIIVLAGES